MSLTIRCLFLIGFLPIRLMGSDTTVQRQLFFRGPEYTKIVAVNSGTPYVYEDSPGLRKVLYYGQWFSDIDLHYDAEDDILMTREINGAIRMGLVKEKVASFYLGSRKFVPAPSLGFCEVLYEGKHIVLVKWQKVLIRQGSQDPFYRTYKRVFVIFNDAQVSIDGRKDLLRLVSKKNTKMAAEQLQKMGLELRNDLPGSTARFVEFIDLNGLYE
jgi:hypothetical protein